MCLPQGSRSRGQDDLTHKLQDINKKNIELKAVLSREKYNAHAHSALSLDAIERLSKLQYEVFSMMNNNIRGHRQNTQRSGTPFKSIADRLKGKDGR
jgi:DNA-directed RNA polymerase subunit A'